MGDERSSTDEPCPPECEAAREGMSASLDGEEPGLVHAWLTEHLVGCPACRDWYGAAVQIRRRTRVAATPDVPDLTARILRQLAAHSAGTTVAAPVGPRPTRSRPRPVDVVRGILAVLGLAQLWISLPLLLLRRDPDVAIHPAHELGSFGVALGVGLLYAAWRPEVARGMRLLVGAIAALLLLTAAVDLAQGGRTSYLDEAPHLLPLAGFVALSALARFTGPAPTTADTSRPGARPFPRESA